MSQRDRAERSTAREGAKTLAAKLYGRGPNAHDKRRTAHYRKGVKHNLSRARRRLDDAVVNEHEREERMQEMSNEELDDKVLGAIKAGKTRATAIQKHLLLGPMALRDLDRSLQRLRRKGFIVYDRAGPISSLGWRPTEKSA